MRRLRVLVFVLPLLAAVMAKGDETLFQGANFRDLEQHGSRFYLTGILGASFATLTSPGSPSVNEDLFTTGGTAGVAFAALDRAWRFEFEGRSRDPITGTRILEDGESTSILSATGGWSAMVNLWRDYDLTDSLTGYLGGGLGGGGYQFGINQNFPIQDSTFTGLGTVGGLAWQIGAGIAFAITDKITLDIGYRYFEIGAGSVPAELAQSGIPIETQAITSAFSANEFFFGIRIYEPFDWRR
jgi:opacity protein-like surface antigen